MTEKAPQGVGSVSSIEPRSDVARLATLRLAMALGTLSVGAGDRETNLILDALDELERLANAFPSSATREDIRGVFNLFNGGGGTSEDAQKLPNGVTPPSDNPSA